MTRSPSLSGSVSAAAGCAAATAWERLLWAGECGISRAPVREALYQLEAEGLLMSHPKRGKCVTILTPDGIRNSYELSGLLESAAAVNAAKGLSAEVHGKLAALVGRMREAVRAGGAFEEHASLGTEFHETILSLSDNPLIRSLASRSSRVISKFLMYERWRTLYTPEELYDRHNRIYEALCSGERRRIGKCRARTLCRIGGTACPVLRSA